LTTIATPHHGSKAVEPFLTVPEWLYKTVSGAADGVRRLFGDKSPDFYSGTHSLSAKNMKEFNQKQPDQSGVYYQSYAAALKAPASEIILCFPALRIRELEGENDGMVSVESAKWTNFKGVLRGAGYRGVSHLDEVDFRRRDLKIQPLQGAGTIREFYVAVVAELRQKGF
jgi:triacylglycerol lipase